jgi:hypothetical protein
MNILTVHEQYSSLLALGEGASWDPGKDPVIRIQRVVSQVPGFLSSFLWVAQAH